jgi:hypothetical protein
MMMMMMVLLNSFLDFTLPLYNYISIYVYILFIKTLYQDTKKLFSLYNIYKMAYGWKTAYKSSITNKNQGGGEKKAGLPYVIGRESYTSILMRERGEGIFSLVNLRKNRFTRIPNQNLPLGFNHGIRMY